MTHKLTSEQDAFVCAVKDDVTSINLRAVAGSGKTSTSVVAVNSLIEKKPFTSIICVAFNKKIADELSQKMDAGVVCKTLNAVGHGAWMRRIDRKLDVNSMKTYSNMRELWGRDFELEEGLEDVPKLVGLGKMVGLVPIGYHKDPERILIQDIPANWEDLIEAYDLNIPDNQSKTAIGMARELLCESIQDAFEGRIDFNDQLYMPVCYGGNFPKGDVILIDEAQDISAINREMLWRMSNPQSRLLGVGDPNQAIYGFRGAAPDSMDRLAEEFESIDMDLTYSFRCSKAVVKEAQKLVPFIQYGPEAVEGSVSQYGPWTKALLTQDDAIICRNTAPVVDVAFRLIRRKVQCFVMGRDIGANLIGLMNRLKAWNLQSLIGQLSEFERFETNKFKMLGRDYKAAAVQDRCDTLRACIESIEDKVGMDEKKGLALLRTTIKDLFTEKRGGVCLSTIHKAKGLEWPNVFILDPHLLPSKYARSEAQKQQERNLEYVAITRAQVNLGYINSGELED